METFEVTFLGDDESQGSWNVDAEEPEDAAAKCLEQEAGKKGTYSVWDPLDPHGMPLVERVVS